MPGNRNPFPRFRRWPAGPVSWSGMLLYLMMLALFMLAVFYTPLGLLFR